MVKYLGKTEHDLDLVTKSYLVQKISNLTDDSALASALSSYIKSSDANNLVSELRSEVEEKLRAKVAKVDGKTLSANDFTNEFRQKLENLYTNDQIEQKIRESVQNIDLSQYITQSVADGKYARADHTHTNFDNLSIGNKLSFGDFGMQYEGGEYPSLTWNHSEAGNILSARKFFVDFWKNFDIHGNEIKGLATPTRDDHAASKGYVDSKVDSISLPDTGITQEQASELYAAKVHSHNSEEIADSVAVVGMTENANKLVKTDGTGNISIGTEPSSENHAVNKHYVDNKVANINIPSSGVTQEQADDRYARTEHTHVSTDITDTITAIGTINSANKIVKTDSTGFLNIIAPTDSSPGKSIVLKSYLDEKLDQKASSDHNHDSTYYQKTEYISDPGASDKADKPLKSNASGGLTLTNTPTENTDAVNKLYVDNKVADISLPDSGMTQTQADQRYIRSNAATSTLGRHLTIDASNDGSYSASLFLKKNNHQYEFFTNQVGKFGAYDKTNSRTLFEADRNTFKHETNVDMSNNRIMNLPEPNGANQPATKSWTEGYVTERINGINIPSAPNLSEYLTQSSADGRYARTSHTHDSAAITNTTNRIGTSASANKVVKLDSRGFLDVVTPNDNSPGNSVIVKSYLDSKLNGKANSSELSTLQSAVTELQNKIRELESNAGKVKDTRTNRYLDVWIGPESQKPDSTNKMVFVEES